MSRSGGGVGPSKAQVHPATSRSGQGDHASRPSSASSVQIPGQVRASPTVRQPRQVAASRSGQSRSSSASSVQIPGQVRASPTVRQPRQVAASHSGQSRSSSATSPASPTKKNIPSDVLQHIARRASNPKKTTVNLALAFGDKQLSKMAKQSRHASIKKYAAKLNAQCIGGPQRTMNIFMRKTNISFSSEELRQLMSRPEGAWMETLHGDAPDELHVHVWVWEQNRTLTIPDTQYYVDNYDKNPVEFDEFEYFPASTEMKFINSVIPMVSNFVGLHDCLQMMFPLQTPNHKHPMYVVEKIYSSLDEEYYFDGTDNKTESYNENDDEYYGDDDNDDDNPIEFSESDRQRIPSLGSVEGGARKNAPLPGRRRVKRPARRRSP